jgi:AcrR family transcriptional regulator
MNPSTREKILAATLGCVDADGLAATSIEDIARRASVGRATIYRHFPGGREQVLSETITWEVGRFFASLEAAISDAPDLAARLDRAFVAGDRALSDHVLLHRLLRTEAEAVLTDLAVATDLVLGLIVAYVAEELEREIIAGRVRADLDIPFAADHLGRLFLSYLGTPGEWDLADPHRRAELVQTRFLAGILTSTSP